MDFFMSFIPKTLQQSTSLKKQTFYQNVPSSTWIIKLQVFTDIVITVVDHNGKELAEKPLIGSSGDYFVTKTPDLITLSFNTEQHGTCEILSTNNILNISRNVIVPTNIIATNFIYVLVPHKIKQCVAYYTNNNIQYQLIGNIIPTTYNILINNQLCTICEFDINQFELAQNVIKINNINNVYNNLYFINNTKKQIIDGIKLSLLNNQSLIFENQSFYIDNISYIFPFIQYK